MARVMMIGYGPLPARGVEVVMAPALRTRHLLKGVLEGGHAVNLFTLPLPGTEETTGEDQAMVPDQYEGLHYQRFTSHSGQFAIKMLNEQVGLLEPDAIIGVNTYASYVAAMLSTTLPLWCDLNGYWMAENQGRCYAEQDDSRLVTAWAVERSILRRLDKFSAVSRPQLHAVIGEMAGIGRLNKYTFNYQFGVHLPNAYYQWPTEEGNSTQPIVRGPIVPEDAFIILWSGAFGPWTDIDTLMEALNDLMGRYPQIHFVSTGGRLQGVDNAAYKTFEEAVESSPEKDRFHHLGWIDVELVPQVFREADLGINVDGPNYVTLFGGRNRLNAMAAEGLAIATTVGTEISEWLEDGNAAVTARIGDPASLIEAIEPWIEQREQLNVYSERALRLMQSDFSYSATTAALRKWLENPANAPDNEAKIKQSGGELADLNSTSINTLEGQNILFELYDSRTLMQTARELEAIRKRPWYRLYKKVTRLFGR